MSTTTTTTTTPHVPSLNNNNNHQRSYSDAQLKIWDICSKPLQSLPVSKDLPRLAKKFSLHVNRQELSWIPHTILSDDYPSPTTPSIASPTTPIDTSAAAAITSNNNSSESECEETALAMIVYHLLAHMHQSILPTKKFQTCAQVPSFTLFNHQVNMNDHVTINQFLLSHFGESDTVTQILKACHQTVIIHVLFGARASLMKQMIHFKDVRGAWKIIVHFPLSHNSSNSNSNSSSLTDHHNNTSTDNSYRLSNAADGFVHVEDEECITVSHKRREQVYMKSTDYAKIVDEYNSKHQIQAANGPTVDRKQPFTQLFQFEWQIRVVFDASSDVDAQQTTSTASSSSEMKVVRVDIELLDILYKNEDGTTNAYPEYSMNQVMEIRKFFTSVDAYAAARLESASSSTDGSTSARFHHPNANIRGGPNNNSNGLHLMKRYDSASQLTATRDSDASYNEENNLMTPLSRGDDSGSSNKNAPLAQQDTLGTPTQTMDQTSESAPSFWRRLLCFMHIR